jgi:ribosome-binding factor A
MKTKRGDARSGRERSQRQLRVGETLRHGLVEALTRGEELRDPALAGVSLTVTEVRVSPDLGNATAFVMPLGGTDTDSVVTALNRAAPFLRSQLAGRVTLRHLPALSFVADGAFDQGAHIDDLLRSPSVRRDLDAAPDTDSNDVSDGS